jgi:phytanoyl-CoA hydroxylase
MTTLAEDFVRDGYVVVPNLVGADDRERIVADSEAFRSGAYPITNLPDDGQILAVHFPHWVSPVALDMVRHAGITAVVSQIAGAHLPGWDGAAKCMQSMLFFKPPGLQGQAWHQDERFIPTRDRSLVGAWIALDDATVDNGCLWVIPGSHRTGRLYPTRDHGRPDEFDPTDESYAFDDDSAVPVEVAAGAVVFFNGYLLHRSLKNRSSRTRMALVNHYMNAWSPLPWMMHKGIDVGTSNYRSVVQVSGDDPYAEDPIVAPPAATFVRPRAGNFTVNDARHIDTSVTINAPIDTVWSTLADLASYREWNDYIVEAVGSGEPGTTVSVTARPTGRDDAVIYDVDVVAVQRPMLMVWEGGLPDRRRFKGDHRWELSATHETTTIVRHHERFTGAHADTILDSMRSTIETDFGRFNDALKAEAERRHHHAG